jgi:hypothetical protein
MYPTLSKKNNFEVTFYRKVFDQSTKKRKDERLGSVEVDDTGTGRHLTVEAKAFRRASPNCQYADVVVTKRI